MSKRKVVVFVYVLAMFMAAMDATITNVALPAMGAAFQIPLSATSAINVGYLVGVAMLLPIAGWLGDRFGTKRVFLISLSIFTVSSLFCGLAESLVTLNMARIIQGAAGGLLTPVGMAILFRTFSPEERPRLSRMIVFPIAVAPALGPIIGGFLVDQLSWRWIFYINIPFGILAVIVGILFLEEYRKEVREHFDGKGFLLSIFGFSMFMYALTQGPSQGWTSPEIWITGVLGLSFMIALIFVEWRATDPLLDLKLLNEPLFRIMSIISACSAAALFGMLYIFPLMYQNALHASALHTGLTVFPEAIGLMISSQLLPTSLKKLGVKRLMILSLTGSVVVFALIAFLSASVNPWIVRVLMFSVGIFLGHSVGALRATAFNHISHGSMARATTLFQVQYRLGSVLGVAILASVIGFADVIGGSQANPITYQWALFGSAIFLILSLIFAIQLKNTGKISEAPPQKARAS
ncbi:drug resistance transporter, EmrB/QacA subfamily [Thermoactinomyces sp. DSM 45891]|nr:drug resistance transporter, EmrB/QacA subfamily [Thermoactinomyces sp. DSM 45891]